MNNRVQKLISGAQTGADIAALDTAIKLSIPYGGWVPKGRLTEKGSLPDKYVVKEMPNSSYSLRTEKNVIDSDGTVILSHGKLTGGSALTKKLAIKHSKPWLHLDLSKMSSSYAARMLNMWIADNGVQVLNVAGPRGSKDPKIYDATCRVLETAFTGNGKKIA